MRKSSLVGHVVEVLGRIRSSRQPADEIVRSFFRSRHYLGSNDRRFISETVYGILRNFRFLDFYVLETFKGSEHQSRIPPQHPLLAYVAFEIKVHKEDPQKLEQEISGLWRMFIRDVRFEDFLPVLNTIVLPNEIERDDVSRIGISYSFPDFIVREWVGRYGSKETEQLCASLNEPAQVTIRVNTLRTTLEHCRGELEREGIATTPTSFSPFGLHLSKRVNAGSLKTFREGYFELQDEGSQLLSMLLEPTRGSTIVDACAGGGGKTLHLGALMENSGMLYAIDLDEGRLNNIRKRMERAGVSIVELYTTDRDSDKISGLREMASGVLIDAPCTGVGTFRRNPGAKERITEEFLDRMCATQRKVLEAYASLVRPGGRLVYCTCSLLRRENEENIEWFLGLHPEFSLVSASGILAKQGVPIESDSHFLTLLPHKVSTDGFFAAVMERR